MPIPIGPGLWPDAEKPKEKEKPVHAPAWEEPAPQPPWWELAASYSGFELPAAPTPATPEVAAEAREDASLWAPPIFTPYAVPQPEVPSIAMLALAEKLREVPLMEGFDRWLLSKAQAMQEIYKVKIEAGQSPIGAFVTTLFPEAKQMVTGAFAESLWGFARKVKRAAGYLVYLDEQDPMIYTGGGFNAIWNIDILMVWSKEEREEKLKDYPELLAYVRNYETELEKRTDEYCVSTDSTRTEAMTRARIEMAREIYPATGIAHLKELIGKGIESWRTGEPLTLDGMQSEAWIMSEGCGYTHLIYPEKKHEYEKLIGEGVSPIDAGIKTQNQLIELVGECLIDPMAWFGVQGAVVKATMKTLKGGARFGAGVLGLTSRLVPGLGNLVDWMLEATVQTQANRWSMGLKDTLQWICKYTNDASEAIEIIQNPRGWEYIGETTAYYRRMFKFAAQALEDSPEIGETLVRLGEKYGLSATDVIDTVVTMAQRKGLKHFLEQAPKLYQVFEKWRGKNLVLRALQTSNSFLVDTWLGLRPAWNVFNCLDNALKAAISGVNPFYAIDRYILRYAKYAPGTADELVDFATQGGKLTISLRGATTKLDDLGRAIPQQAVGALGARTRPGLARQYVEEGIKGITGWARGETAEKVAELAKKGIGAEDIAKLAEKGIYPAGRVPIVKTVKRALGKAAKRNYKLGTRIEIFWRSRIFFKEFFEFLDDGWATLAYRPVGYKGVEVSQTVGEMVATDLRKIAEPTVADIQELRAKYAGKARKIKVVQLGQSSDFTPTDLDARFTQNIVDQLDDLALSGNTTAVDVKRVFTRANDALEYQRIQALAQTQKVFADTLPPLSIDAEEMWQTLLPVEKPTLAHLSGAVEDLGLFRARVHLETEKVATEAMSEFSQMAAKARAAESLEQSEALWNELFAAKDKFWKETYGDLWRKYFTAENELLTRIADNADEILSGLKRTERFPRTLIEQYAAGRKSLQELYVKKSDMQGLFMSEIRGPHDVAFKDNLMGAMNYQTDRLMRMGMPAAQDTVNTALTGMKKFFADAGIEAESKGLSLAELGQNVDQWRVRQKLQQSLDAINGQYDDMVVETRRWSRSTMRTRITPVADVPLPAAEKRILNSYFDDLVVDTGNLISNAEERALQIVDNVLFSYAETPNWMKLGGHLTPFVRWPIKNIPLWMDIFAEKPYLLTTAARLRQAQAIINRDLPTRFQYTIPITPVFSDNRFFQALGLANTQLRINPWSYISIFQQLPGGTPYKAQQIEAMFDEAEYGGDMELKNATDMLVEFAGQLGFSGWPYWDYLLGMFGFLGKDWYPRDALGTWAPLVNWAENEIGSMLGQPGRTPTVDADRFIRDKLPEFWNAIFGNTPFAWQELNPDLMLTWLQGREIEGLIMEIPEEEQRRIAELSPEEQAIAMEPYQQVALRQALKKKVLSTLVGNTFGLYVQPIAQTEIDARLGRMQKRMRQEAIGPGEKYREFEKLWREEHPWFGLVQRWRFSEYPWATTSAEAEAETWDTILQDYKAEWWNYNDQWKVKFEATLAELTQRYPGQRAMHKEVKADLYEQRAETLRRMNEELQAELETRMEVYQIDHPKDLKGIKLLNEGWSVPMYRQVHLTEDERLELNLADVPVEEMIDVERGRASTTAKQIQMQAAWEAARNKRQNALVEMVQIPGLQTEGGIKMDLSASENSRTQEEIWEMRIGNILRLLAEAAPDYEDYEVGKEWWVAYQAYLGRLTEEALKLPVVQEQIQTLMQQQHMSMEKATETVAGWYTQDELEEYWRANDTVWEALEQAYQLAYVAPADAIYQSEVKPLKEMEDYSLYMATKEAFFMQNGPVDARDMIPYIMTLYPDRFETGEWNQKMLEDAFRTITMPGIQDRWRYRSTGRTALTSYVYYYYNKLTANQKRDVQQAFGISFTEMFLEGKEDELTPELLGGWVTALSDMFANPIDWRTIPGVVEESLKSGALKEKRDYGLPVVGPMDAEEYEMARKINLQYWNLRAQGDPNYKVLENDVLRKKWFASVPQSLFWDYYYRSVPPGAPGKVLRENPLVGLILDKGIRDAVATKTDYERALQLMESWTMLNSELLYDYPQEEYEEARRQISEYFDIPAENKDARKAYKDSHPLLVKYLTSPKGTSGSGTGSGGKTVSGVAADRRALKDLWVGLQNTAGAKFQTVYVLLSRAWRGTLGVAGMQYLRNLYTKMGLGISFEEWLDKLRQAANLYGFTRSRGSMPKQPSDPPRVTYGGSYSLRGYRRVR